MDIEKLESTIDKTEIKNAKRHLQCVKDFVKKFKKQNPDIPDSQILEMIDIDFIKNANKYYDTIDSISGIKIQLLIREYLLNNEKVLKSIYQKFKNQELKKDENRFYVYDNEKSSKMLVKDLLYEMRRLFKKKNLNPTSEEEYDTLKIVLKSIETSLLKQQKKDNITLLQTTNEFFNNYNYWETLELKQKSQLKRLWLEELIYEDSEIQDSFETKNLEKLSNDELSVLNIFWQNKYSKLQNAVGFGYFVLNQLNLTNDMKNIDQNIDDETIKNLLIKYKTLEKLSTQIYNMKLKGKNPEKLIKKLELDYQKTFSSLLPDLKNSLQDDITQCIDRFMSVRNIYAVKANLICGVIVDFVDNKKLKNWGYINDNKDTDLNSIQTQNQNIAIAIDYPGLNRPIVVHIDSDLLLNTLMNTKQTTMLPIYEGIEDFYSDYDNINGNTIYDLLPNHITLPLEKRQKKFIQSKEIPEGNRKYKFLQHCKFLANPDKFPKHLKGPDR